MKKLVIIFVIVLLLSGATVGVMKFMGLGPFKSDEVVEEPVERPVNRPEALFVDMDPLLINVVQNGEIIMNIQMEVKLETVGTDNIIAIKRMLPKYKDAFMQDLHSFVPRMFNEIERLDLPVIKQRLQLIADRVAGQSGIVNGVLIQSIIDTPQQQQ